MCCYSMPSFLSKLKSAGLSAHEKSNNILYFFLVYNVSSNSVALICSLKSVMRALLLSFCADQFNTGQDYNAQVGLDFPLWMHLI